MHKILSDCKNISLFMKNCFSTFFLVEEQEEVWIVIGQVVLPWTVIHFFSSAISISIVDSSSNTFTLCERKNPLNCNNGQKLLVRARLAKLLKNIVKLKHGHYLAHCFANILLMLFVVMSEQFLPVGGIGNFRFLLKNLDFLFRSTSIFGLICSHLQLKT